MSTFKIEAEGLLDGLFPEWHWEELSRAKYDEIFQELTGIGDELEGEIVEIIKKRGIKIGFHKQYKSGGGWTVLRNITLCPGDDPLSPYVLSLIIHETFHINQSIWMRLSMQGELRAWQYQKKAYQKLTGHDIGDYGQAYSGTKRYWDEIGSLSSESREDLERAKALTKGVASDYRSDCLPLFPLPKEIWFYLRQGDPAKAFATVKNLVTCK